MSSSDFYSFISLVNHVNAVLASNHQIKLNVPLISIEGLPGSGKSTQAENIASELRSKGIRAEYIELPGVSAFGDILFSIYNDDVLFKNIRKQYPWLNLLFLSYDINNEIKKKIAQGAEMIIMARGILSTMLFNLDLFNFVDETSVIDWDGVSPYLQAFPFPDAIFYLELKTDEAYQRLIERSNRPIRKMDHPEVLRNDEKKMKRIMNLLSDQYDTVVIDGNRDIDSITSDIVEEIIKRFSSRKNDTTVYNFPIDLCRETQDFLLRRYDSKTLDAGFYQIKKLSLYADNDILSIDPTENLIWTLLGEFGLPYQSHENHSSWPLYIFPYSIKYKNQIIQYLLEHEFIVNSSLELQFSQELHFSLYGGQAWYGSLISALHQYHQSIEKVWGEKGLLIYFKKNPDTKTSLSMMARRLQIHLRPQLSEYWNKNAYDVYPGILKSFHTPNIYDIEIHKKIFEYFTQLSKL